GAVGDRRRGSPRQCERVPGWGAEAHRPGGVPVHLRPAPGGDPGRTRDPARVGVRLRGGRAGQPPVLPPVRRIWGTPGGRCHPADPLQRVRGNRPGGGRPDRLAAAASRTGAAPAAAPPKPQPIGHTETRQNENGEPMPTTVYGHWTNIIDPTSSTVEQTVAKLLMAADPDWAAALEESGILEDIVQEFRDAINDALPTGVTLAGSEFVGPAD